MSARSSDGCSSRDRRRRRSNRHLSRNTSGSLMRRIRPSSRQRRRLVELQVVAVVAVVAVVVVVVEVVVVAVESTRAVD